MVVLAALPTSCWSDEYLLSHCEGYRVVDETGEPIGLIDCVLWPEDQFGAAAAAVVVGHGDRRHEVVVPFAQVIEIQPWAERVVVSAAPAK